MTSSRLAVALLLLALVVCCALTATAFVETEWRHSVDGAIYVVTARSLAAGDGYSYLGQPFFVRPPGLAWALQPFVDAPVDWALVNRLMQLVAALGFVAVAACLARAQRVLPALGAALLFALCPLTLETFNEIFSEFPYVLLFFGGVWLLCRDREGRAPGWPRSIAGALLLGASLWFRSIGLLVLPGLVIVDLFARRREGQPAVPRWRGFVLAAVVVAVVLPWNLHAGAMAEEAPRPSTQLLMFDYGTAMFRTNPSDPASPLVDVDGWIGRVQSNGVLVADALSHALLGTENQHDRQTALSAAGVLALALTLAALGYALVVRRSLLDWYGAAYMALMFTYFTFVDRLLMPLMPVVYSSLLFTVGRLARLGPAERRDQREASGWLAAGGWLLAVALVSLPRATEADHRRKVNYEADRATAEWIVENTAPGARILHEKGAILTVLSGRPTFTWRNLPGPWPEGAPEVDWVILGPRKSDELVALGEAVAPEAVEALRFSVDWHAKKKAMVFAYRMR